jgi:hypothetical protein
MVKNILKSPLVTVLNSKSTTFSHLVTVLKRFFWVFVPVQIPHYLAEFGTWCYLQKKNFNK